MLVCCLSPYPCSAGVYPEKTPADDGGWIGRMSCRQEIRRRTTWVSVGDGIQVFCYQAGDETGGLNLGKKVGFQPLSAYLYAFMWLVLIPQMSPIFLIVGVSHWHGTHLVG